MARTSDGRRLTELHRKQQLALTAKLVREVATLWRLWRPSDPASYKALEDVLVLLVKARAPQAAALSARYYELFRAADAPKAVMRAAVPLAAKIDELALRGSISATARASIYAALAAGKPYEAAMATAQVRVSGAVARHVLNNGRDTITDEMLRDEQATGWTRATGGDPCAFCAMLASRGPVYKEESADFLSHDHCQCYPEPAYRGSEWPGRGREWQDLWQETGAHESGKDAVNAFRRAYEGRAV